METRPFFHALARVPSVLLFVTRAFLIYIAGKGLHLSIVEATSRTGHAALRPHDDTRTDLSVLGPVQHSLSEAVSKPPVLTVSL
jgi:hypothetical protein